jgi:hypothetical protein
VGEGRDFMKSEEPSIRLKLGEFGFESGDSLFEGGRRHGG